MKVLHITYSTEGGAGIAAYRLHTALLNEGIESNILCLKTKKNEEEIVAIGYKPLGVFNKILNKFYPINVSTRNKKRIEKYSGGYEIYSFPETDIELVNHPLVRKTDVINLHWVGGFVNISTFFKNVKKPIVWTLHDQNPFLGGFHYGLDVVKNIERFSALETELKNVKNKAYKNSTLNTVVAPSNWLKKESEKSELLGAFNHTHIYNTLDKSIFMKIDMKKAREKLNLPNDKIIFSFVSQSIDNSRKGYEDLVDAIEQLNNNKLLFIAIGAIPDTRHEKIKYLGSIDDESIMALVYNASEAFILPSKEDNLPNTMLESLFCGTPVIGSPVGGIKEEIISNSNGMLVVEGKFADAINNFLKFRNEFKSSLISLDAQKKYGQKKVVKDYLKLYEKINS